ncbi:MAG: hypothetical protein INR69_12755 [Mucilaginibacter polytrichastri]|nr:hypothetical protein [Mucilaginibacter polytrichastri]
MIFLLRIIIAFCLLSHAVYQVSQPSDWSVAIGVTEVLLSLTLLFQPIRRYFKSNHNTNS